MAGDFSLESFHPVVRHWFLRRYRTATPPQSLGWPSIASGTHTLILAPTGSGKTLAAFLWAINHLIERHLRETLPPGIRILYVSPLKALNNDIERNLQEPLHGIGEEARRTGVKLPPIRTAVRTGDTPASARAAMLKHPPDILITTPESLYLMLTAPRARSLFATTTFVIVDEIHALSGNKRGVHLSLTLERLQALANREFVRIGLSATQRPLERIAAFLGGLAVEDNILRPRPVRVIDAGGRKTMDLRVECPVDDFSSVPQEGVWPAVFDALLSEIVSHRSTLVFVNNRRLAERTAAALNERIIAGKEGAGEGPIGPTNLHAVPHPMEWTGSGAGQRPPGKEGSETPSQELPLVQAYHGSMSRQARAAMEEQLKAGGLKALVATSSLELGIDIGAIDLVVQLQSPKSVARGLQRVGRSGHLVTAASKGRILPTFREDLVESAVVAKAMQGGDIEATRIPEDCLDVLAQQIVAMVSIEEWNVDDLFDLVHHAYPYRNLSHTLFMGVVEMLSGRYSGDAFRELRPRISWDRVNGMLRPLPGSGRIAVTSGGTIADRGYFGVYLEDGRTRVGEVDEEFVFESRVGDTFVLGSSVWRIAGLDPQRVTVAPAPGQPARMPFWRGEGIGRSFELGMLVGAFRRELSVRVERGDALAFLQHEYPVDARAAWNIEEYFRRQQAAGIIPHDRLIVVEGFRDEIGDPRIVVHATFGRRVNGLLGMVLAATLQEMTGAEPQMHYNDEGILLRCTDIERLPLNLFDGLNTHAARERVLEEVLSSPLFAGQFRQNAARALLLPRLAPGRRTPLWLQRLRAADLLQIARQHDDFPIVIETMRDVLNDVLDLDSFTQVVQSIEEGSIAVTTMETEIPSPFAAGLIFDFIAAYMYDADQPRADRLSQYLTVNRELLSEVVSAETLPAMLRPEAVEEVEREAQHSAVNFKARSPEELMEILVRVGDLTEEEIQERSAGDGAAMLAALARDGRAVQIAIAGTRRWIAGEDRELYRRVAAGDVPDAVVRRFVRGHGPSPIRSLATRFGVSPETITALTESWNNDRSMVRGRFLPPGTEGADELQWCYRPIIERIHKRTLTILRKEITPAPMALFTRFLFSWQHLGEESRETGAEGIQTVLEQMQGLPLPAEMWERDILRSRVRSYNPAETAALTSAGSLVWSGAGTGKTRCFFRGEGYLFVDPPTGESLERLSEPARRIRAFLEHHGASFFTDIREETRLSLDALNTGIAELFWSGIITNDVLAELNAVKRSLKGSAHAPMERSLLLNPRHDPARGRIMQSVRKSLRQVPGWTGRWSLLHTPAVMGDVPSLEEKALRQTLQLLARYGVLAREFHRREEALPWSVIASTLRWMELRGEVRRGYFVEGLSGMQYALPAAVEELRRTRSGGDAPVLVSAADPANPYGPGLPVSQEPESRSGLAPSPGGITRTPGTYLGFVNGSPALVIEGFGARLRTIGRIRADTVAAIMRSFLALERLPAGLRPFREVVVEHIDGERPAHHPLSGTLRELGFESDQNQTLRWDAYR